MKKIMLALGLVFTAAASHAQTVNPIEIGSVGNNTLELELSWSGTSATSVKETRGYNTREIYRNYGYSTTALIVQPGTYTFTFADLTNCNALGCTETVFAAVAVSISRCGVHGGYGAPTNYLGEDTNNNRVCDWAE